MLKITNQAGNIPPSSLYATIPSICIHSDGNSTLLTRMDLKSRTCRYGDITMEIIKSNLADQPLQH